MADMDISHGFQLLREKQIPEINTLTRLYRHVKTGAEMLSMINEDENKTFGIVFRTPAPDSTGLPHILEHAVLDGSRKYPLREPFVELLKGSLKTFLNAFTYPDKTCYPVASQNINDLYNLIDVYMDAVFFPLISPHTFQQEGWHFELNKLEEPLTYKGVVFNEMKGALSSPDDLLAQRVQESLFPGNVYGRNAGGDPAVIPQLTYEQFKKFHETYYHPSNARIYFYGDDDPDERLRLMDEYLKDFRQIQADSAINLQPAFERPQKLEFPYDASEEEGDGTKKSMLTVNWLLADTTDPQINLALSILAHILIGTPASPLRKTLIDSGLGEDLAGVGLERDLRQAYLSTGLKGIAVEDADKVEHLVLKTLERLADEGIDQNTVAASVNTVEFRLRENNTGSFPRGLLLMLRCLTTWLYDDDPIKVLAFEDPLKSIKARLAAGEHYFEDLIRCFFVNNHHRTTVLLKPDRFLRQQQDQDERQRLDKARKAMSQQDLQAVLENTGQLKKRQETPDSPEALATIPSLKLSDLDRQTKIIPIQVQTQDGATILYHDLFTNGIVYLDLGFNLYMLPQEFLPYTTLFGRALLEMGTETEDVVKLSQRIGRTTGGIRPVPFTSAVRDHSTGAARLFLRGKATSANGNELLDVLRDILLTVRLNNQERFRQLVLEEKANQEAGLVPMGHELVDTRLKAQFTEAGWAAEQIGGLEYLFFLRHLAETVVQDWSSVLENLETMRRLLISREGLLCNVTLDEKNYKTFQPLLTSFLAKLPSSSANSAKWKPVSPPGYEGLTIPAQVNYVGKAANLYQLGYKLNGSIQVITHYLGATWLWEKVRVQGGAYGGFCQFDHRSGVLSYLSYRDPNLLSTLENYDDTTVFLRHIDSTRLNEEELAKTIIGTIGAIDMYQLPDAKGFTSMVRYMVGETDETRQKLRDEVLSTSLKDFHAFGDVLNLVNESGLVVVLGSQEAIQAVNAARENWLTVQKVL